MANETVYPFGQGGSVPSGYPIADDLNTNSAQQALSAKQGFVIRPYIMDTWSAVDLSQITNSDYQVSDQGIWRNDSLKHKVVPVTPGQTIRLTVQGTSGSAGGFYAFFTSSYVVPTSQGVSAPLLPGTSRIWKDNGTYIITIPDGTAYLYLNTRDGDGVKTFSVDIMTAQSSLVQRSEIVDSLLSERTDAPLSANQGRVLAERMSSQIPAGLTKHDYSGPLVKIDTQHKVATKQVTSISAVSCQGGACYGNYFFLFNGNNTTCWVYDLSTATLLQTITVTDRGFVSNCHCNTVNFGTEKYDDNDPFPLIYVSTGYNDGTDTGAIVYRIVATTEDDVTTYSLSLVQTLKMPGATWTEFVVGDDGCCYLCYTNTRTIYRMKMPKLSDGDLTFDLSEALETYQFSPQPSWYNGSRNQCRIFYRGKIYMVSGVPSAQEAVLFIVLDLATQTREVEIDLKNTLGFTKEPEAVFIWNGHFCINFNSYAPVYALYFE